VCVACFGCAVLGAGAYFFMYSCAPKMTAAINRKTSTKRCSVPGSDCGLLYSGIRLSDWCGNRRGREPDQIRRARTDDSAARARPSAHSLGVLRIFLRLKSHNRKKLARSVKMETAAAIARAYNQQDSKAELSA